ncbi:hypothetical protein EVB91_016 [Rhizobium phage RHph_I1_18]|nr:hypothetical protein EVB91_016 [Rhizobium phage RHph_I1_18]
MISFKQHLNESTEFLYHGTSLDNAVKIIESGKLISTNSRSRDHDGVAGISLTRSLKRAGDYGVVFIFSRSKLSDLDIRPHVNKSTTFYGDEEEEKIFLQKGSAISLQKYCDGFKLQAGYFRSKEDHVKGTFYRFSPRGPKVIAAIEQLSKSPLFLGTYS